MFTAVVTPPGGQPVELTPLVDSVGFSTVAVGGFASCTLAVPLDQVRASQVPRLSDVRLLHGSRVLWEGRVEDHDADYVAATLGLECFGYQRLLEDVSVKRIWSLRSVPWQLMDNMDFGAAGFYFLAPHVWSSVTVGRIDDTDLTKWGLRFETPAGGGLNPGPNDAHGAWTHIDADMILFKSFSESVDVGTGISGMELWDSPDGVTWTHVPDFETLHAGARFLRVVARWSVAGAADSASSQTVRNIRILGATTPEDVAGGSASGSGGFYPRTLLEDLIEQVPGLSIGDIVNDTSFAVTQLSRVQRDRALSVVQEITSYYRRRWGVWEDRRFDWKAVNLDEPQWVLKLADLTGCKITSSVDNSVREVFLAYQNAATGLPEEESAQSTDRRNDYVRLGQTKDEVLAAPVGMTPASAARLAQRVADDHGVLPAVRGTVKIPAFTLVANLVGAAMPACYIRAGENVLIPELPKDDYLRPGRDGQTLFHVTSAETDMERAETTLALDGYSRSSDILMARIAAATRVLTG
jgi:hypothetical protein